MFRTKRSDQGKRKWKKAIEFGKRRLSLVENRALACLCESQMKPQEILLGSLSIGVRVP